MKRTSFNDTMFRNAHRDSFLRLLFGATTRKPSTILGQKQSLSGVLFAVAGMENTPTILLLPYVILLPVKALFKYKKGFSSEGKSMFAAVLGGYPTHTGSA